MYILVRTLPSLIMGGLIRREVDNPDEIYLFNILKNVQFAW